MGKEQWAIIATVALTGLGVFGDSLLKIASGQHNLIWNKWFLGGLLVFASTAFGWVFVMRYLKLASIGALYAVTMTLLLTLVGVVFFRERLGLAELVGVVLAIVAVVLLGSVAQ